MFAHCMYRFQSGGGLNTAQFDVLPSGGYSFSQGAGSLSTSRTLQASGSSSHISGGRVRAAPVHVLSISAAVTRLSWRPPAFAYSLHDSDLASMDPHDGMMAIATGPVKGRAGGNGLLSLWSHHRPFMALSVLEGHQEGAVTDFVWLDTPRERSQQTSDGRTVPLSRGTHSDVGARSKDQSQRGESRGRFSSSPSLFPPGRGARSDSDDAMINVEDDEVVQEDSRLAGNVWQHVLSVGRDGRCLLQSFARGMSVTFMYLCNASVN